MAGPGESSHLEVVPIAVIVLQGFVVDHVDDWHHEGEGVLLDPGEERLQPARVALAVAVQEEDHVPTGGPGTRQPGPDETNPLLKSDDSHLAVLSHVLLQLGLEVGVLGGVVHQDDLLQEAAW